MKKYSVTVPITGIIFTEVEAESEEGAIDKALEAAYTFEDISEWDTCRQIVRGNIFYGHTNEAEADQLEE